MGRRDLALVPGDEADGARAGGYGDAVAGGDAGGGDLVATDGVDVAEVNVIAEGEAGQLEDGGGGGVGLVDDGGAQGGIVVGLGRGEDVQLGDGDGD